MLIFRTTQTVFVSDVLELVGADEQVDEGHYSEAVEVDLSHPASSGELLGATLYSNQPTDGPFGAIFVFDGDPEITLNDADLTIAQRRKLLGHLCVSAWYADDSSGHASVLCDVPVYFGRAESLFLVWYHRGAQSINAEAEDNETLEIRVWGHHCPVK